VCGSSIVVGITADLIGFVGRQFFCYYGLHTVRKHLDETITKIAADHIGGAESSLFGSEASAALSVPVTLAIGEIIATGIRQVVLIVVNVASRIFSHRKDKPKTALAREVALNVVSYATYFFTKLSFCNYFMPYVKAGVELGLRKFVAIPFLSLSPTSVLASPLAIIASPSLVFILGDVLGIVVGEITYELASRAYCDTKKVESSAAQ
jgi:hypothetical protein